MALKIALQMDPVEAIDINGDSSFALGLEAQARGYELFYYHPNHMSYEDGQVSARIAPLIFRREQNNHFTKGNATQQPLTDMDVILLRQDPPFDMAYLSTTYLLEMIHPQVLVVNNPSEVRNAPEKIYINQFQQFLPPTLITRDAEALRDFRQTYKDIILKPLFGNGGIGIFHIKPDDDNFSTILEMFFASSRDPIMAQSYIPQIRQGDKRIILVDGEPIGAINRIPPAGEARANLHVGGTAHKAVLTRREQDICAAMGPELKERGLIFVGIDVIGDYLTEINVTSPTGLQELARFDGSNPTALIWDAIERRL